jgi:solute carrier family 13 (sodium-dependent dicarboxylate transporter), member 2/3/5
MALLMFCIPAHRGSRTDCQSVLQSHESGRVHYLMDWQTAERLPWGILLLIGGGFALASGFAETGLSHWLGDVLAGRVATWHPVLLVAAICLLMTFLTEFTTNVATVNAILPVLAGTAVGIGIDPRLIMIPAALSTSCAFMLPIATPPNAIVFGSGKIPMQAMIRYGFLLNLIGIVLVTTVMLVLGTRVMHIPLP